MNKNVKIKILNKLTFYSNYMKRQVKRASVLQNTSSLEHLDQHELGEEKWMEERERQRVRVGHVEEGGREHGMSHGGWPLFIVFAPPLWHKLFPTWTPHLGLISKKSSYLSNKLNLKRCFCLSCSLVKQLFPCMCGSLSICTIVISSRNSSTNF